SVSGATIGGTTPAMRNVLAGVDGDLILAGSDGLTVQGNYIGVDATGTAALGHGARGINIEKGTGITIGGTTAGAGNVFGTWTEAAIQPGADCACTIAAVTIQGNMIGTDASGTTGIAAGSVEAIHVQRAGDVTIGGSATGAGNVITNP